ncbi:MAG: DUF3604 domain-containing protein [Halioglobus sp.]|nr:DUF3604 domain-containing protein [Halioglobus sp.]
MRALLCTVLLLVNSLGYAVEYTEERAPCAVRDPLRQPFFGDLHVHTRYSLDASTQGTRTTPAQAYEFARGTRLGIQPWSQDGRPARSLQLARPLDFAMVSDHAELIGEVHMCNTPGVEGHNSWQCILYRNWQRGAYFLFNYMASMQATHMGQCGKDDALCLDAARVPWAEMQEAAEAHYDRSPACSFTSFIGYEWTGLFRDNGGNLHRNVLFRNADVPALPISFIDQPGAQQLWRALDSQCQGDCEALVIPHNSNLSAGMMFSGKDDRGAVLTPQVAATRMRYEPVVEIMQHKGSSECYFAAGVGADELCAFEQQPDDNIARLDNPPQPTTGFVREALTRGLGLQRQLGINPYAFGFIASTDTHLGTPGAVSEREFLGHGGAGDSARDRVPEGLPDRLEYNPGGLAVAWAEENSRDALFEAFQRREVYGTSGPRIVTRFFGGWDYPQDLCFYPDHIRRADEGGVPMGGDLVGTGTGGPTFLVAASQDPGTESAPGMPLQRLQIIKGWLTATGMRREEVIEVAGEPFNNAGVDIDTCTPSGEGFAQLCGVWTDDDFDPEQGAWYYARAVENPSCRWSQRMCVANGVDCDLPDTIRKGLEGCCSEDHRPVVQERAWTSPIWYTPTD